MTALLIVATIGALIFAAHQLTRWIDKKADRITAEIAVNRDIQLQHLEAVLRIADWICQPQLFATAAAPSPRALLGDEDLAWQVYNTVFPSCDWKDKKHFLSSQTGMRTLQMVREIRRKLVGFTEENGICVNEMRSGG